MRIPISPRRSHGGSVLQFECSYGKMRGPGDLDSAFSAATQAGIDAIYAVSSRHMVASVTRIVDFATKSRLPLAGGWGTWVQAGALISYGPNVGNMVRLAAVYVDKILKGAKPADLPVQQPTRFELVITQRGRSSPSGCGRFSC